MSVCALVFTGCTQVPELEATIPTHLRNAPYPELIALDATFETAQHPREQASQIDRLLAARRASLQSRARRLNTDVLDPETRKRMRDGIEQ